MSAPFTLNIETVKASQRLSALRTIAADKGKPSWREARPWGLHNWHSAFCELSQGFNGEGRSRVPVWSTHTGEQFRDERYCSDVRRMDHTSWFTDTFQDSEARGIVGRLPHGRFIAGYEWSCNDERVYFGDVFDDEGDAALMADEHARVFAEREREYDERLQAAHAVEIAIGEAKRRLRECLTLRHNPCFKYARDEVAELIASIRSNCDNLKTNYAGVL